jgi:hypothetical protein
MRTIAPELRFDFNISNLAARGTTGAKWTEGYPGDDVVDVISADVYDHYNRWAEMMAGDAGLYELREFAKARKKPEAFAEWACAVTAHGHGDNAGFIRAMSAWMAARPGKVLYHAYWNSTEGAGALLLGASSGLLVDAAATFRRIYGPDTPPTITSIPDQVVPLNGRSAPLAFTFDDGQTPIERLTLLVNVSNPALFPPSHIAIGGQWSQRTVTLTPVSNRTGWSTVWLKVGDGASSTVTSFVVNVIADLAIADIGTPARTGVATRYENTFTLQAGGYDIYNRRDEFQFGHVPLAGDCELTVRVASLTPTHPWAKGGLMMRSSLAEDAAHVAVYVTPARGVVLQWRREPGGGTASSVPIPGTTPQWLRLIRAGNAFLAYCSTDGKSWEFVDAAEVNLPGTVHAGIAVTSHDSAAVSTAMFEYFDVD